jgi:plasmid stabilization system protein ParE
VQVVWTAPALSDLAEIRAYIGRDNPAAASRVAVSLVAAADSLEFFPRRGRPTDEPEIRELVAVHPYIIVYRVKDDGVEILRVWHGARLRR